MKQIHPTLDFLELYALNRIDGVEEAEVEEHLLVCARCQHRLERVDQKIQIIQTSLAANLAATCL